MVLGIVFHPPCRTLTGHPYLLSTIFSSPTTRELGDIRLTPFIMIADIIAGGAGLPFLRPLTVLAKPPCCVLTGTATSAPVVAGLLGGSIPVTAAYTIISNLSVAFIGPLFLSLIGHSGETVSFATSFWYIFRSVMPILIIPFLLALFINKASPKLHRKIQSAQIISFYIWAVALTVVIETPGSYASGRRQLQVSDSDRRHLPFICLLQFYFGSVLAENSDASWPGTSLDKKTRYSRYGSRKPI